MQENSEPIQRSLNSLKDEADSFERELNIVLSHTHVDKMDQLNKKFVVNITTLIYILTAYWFIQYII